MSVTRTSCEQCAWAEWRVKDGVRIQVGCQAGQLDKYQALRERIDPTGHPVDHSVFKLTEMGETTAYIINFACPFQRSEQWAHDNDAKSLSSTELRSKLFSVIPFDYGLVVISDGLVRGTLKTVKHVCNGTIPPRWVEIVNRQKHNSTKFIEEIVLTLRDRMGKDISVPELGADNAKNFINFRQMADDFPDNNREMVLEAIKARHGYFWVLVLQANTKIDAGFMESIKRLVLDLEVDFHLLSLSPDEGIAVAPVLLGSADFHPSAAFIYKGGTMQQEFRRNYVQSFFNIVD